MLTYISENRVVVIKKNNENNSLWKWRYILSQKFFVYHKSRSCNATKRYNVFSNHIFHLHQTISYFRDKMVCCIKFRTFETNKPFLMQPASKCYFLCVERKFTFYLMWTDLLSYFFPIMFTLMFTFQLIFIISKMCTFYKERLM